MRQILIIAALLALAAPADAAKRARKPAPPPQTPILHLVNEEQIADDANSGAGSPLLEWMRDTGPVIGANDAPMDVILERIRKRGRAFEQSIDRGYLEDLVAAYGRFFASFDEAPLLMIDTAELNFPARESDLDVVLSTLRDFPKAGERRRIIGGSRAPERQPNLV